MLIRFNEQPLTVDDPIKIFIEITGNAVSQLTRNSRTAGEIFYCINGFK